MEGYYNDLVKLTLLLQIWKMAEDLLQNVMTPMELKHMLTYYFIKVVDLRESTLGLESFVSSLEVSSKVISNGIFI